MQVRLYTFAFAESDDPLNKYPFAVVRHMLVTVAVAVYNGARYIPECIQCLADQTFRDFEVLFVVDSKTTDGSAELIESWMGVLPEARIIIQDDDMRMSGARNIGIREAKGDVIWLLDVDDHPYPDFLSVLVEVMESTGADIVACNSIHVRERTPPAEIDREYRIREMTGVEAVGRFHEFPVYCWARIQKKSIFDNGDSLFVTYSSMEDLPQTIIELANAKKVCYVGKPLYVYYKMAGTATLNNRSTDIQAIDEVSRITTAYIRDHVPEAYPEFSRNMLNRLMRNLTYCSYGEFKEVRERSIAKELLDQVQDKSFEMRVFEKIPALYYLILYPFSHYVWDRKDGLWDKGEGK